VSTRPTGSQLAHNPLNHRRIVEEASVALCWIIKAKDITINLVEVEPAVKIQLFVYRLRYSWRRKIVAFCANKYTPSIPTSQKDTSVRTSTSSNKFKTRATAVETIAW